MSRNKEFWVYPTDDPEVVEQMQRWCYQVLGNKQIGPHPWNLHYWPGHVCAFAFRTPEGAGLFKMVWHEKILQEKHW